MGGFSVWLPRSTSPCYFLAITWTPLLLASGWLPSPVLSVAQMIHNLCPLTEKSSWGEGKEKRENTTLEWRDSLKPGTTKKALERLLWPWIGRLTFFIHPWLWSSFLEAQWLPHPILFGRGWIQVDRISGRFGEEGLKTISVPFNLLIIYLHGFPTH